MLISHSNESSVNPVLVVGVFRSGTSLLYSLLNQHPQIALMYECDVWNFPGAFSGWRFKGEWLARQEFYNQALSRHRLILGDSLRGLEQVQTPEELYRCHGVNKGAVLWGEKSPVYSTRLGRLATQYPGGSFILIWRDPVEIYRSIRAAGEKSSFFRQPAMLHRLIYHQERMIRAAGRLERKGVRLCHVNYDELVDNTPEVCRHLCKFLRIEFNPRMTGLEQADFSAVYHAPQHDFLRRGVVERRPAGREGKLVEPAAAQKLVRFRKRWERLASRALSHKPIAAPAAEPTAAELYFHQGTGALLHVWDGCKRLSFELLPLSWLRTYRLFKNWLFCSASPGDDISLAGQMLKHGFTISFSFSLMLAVCSFDYFTGPEISCGPLYLIPCGILALVVGRNWATIAAVGCAVSVTVLRDAPQHIHLALTLVTLWNTAMRFIFFEIFVLLLDRIRRDLGLRAQTSDAARTE